MRGTVIHGGEAFSAVGGPYPTLTAAQERAQTVRRLRPVQRSEVTRDPRPPNPEPGRRWFTLLTRSNGVRIVIGPFPSRRRARAVIAEWTALLGDLAEASVDYAHDPGRYPRTWTRRGGLWLLPLGDPHHRLIRQSVVQAAALLHLLTRR